MGPRGMTGTWAAKIVHESILRVTKDEDQRSVGEQKALFQ